MFLIVSESCSSIIPAKIVIGPFVSITFCFVNILTSDLMSVDFPTPKKSVKYLMQDFDDIYVRHRKLDGDDIVLSFLRR